MRRRWVSAGLSLSLVLVSALRGGPASPANEAAWLERAKTALLALEYAPSQTPRGLQAPNRAHELRTYFEPTGIRVHERSSSRDELFALTLAGVGRGDALAAVAPGRVTRGSERVEIRRDSLVEWYRNGPDGLEQGFDLAQRPAGEGELVLELELRGGRALPGPADSLDIRTAAGRTLRYQGLRADDAVGQSLPARLELAAAGRIRIRIDDRHATYPIVVDPFIVQPAVADTTLTGVPENPPGVGDLNGDGFADAIFGAPFSDQGQVAEGVVGIAYGAAAGIPSGSSAFIQQIQSNITNARFGTSVSSGGDLNGDGYQDLLASAPGVDTVYVFLGGPTGVTGTTVASAHAALQPAGAGEFGISAAFAGDVNGDGFDDIVVGDLIAGRAQLWLGSASGITSPTTPSTTLTAPAGTFAMASHVAGAGDVNADGFDDVLVNAENYGAGTAYVYLFRGSASGIASGDASLVFNARVVQTVPSGAFGPPRILGTAAGDTNNDSYADVLVGVPGLGAGVIFLGNAAGNLQDTSSQFFGALGYSGAVAALGDANADGWADVIVGPASQTAMGVFLGQAGGVSETALGLVLADQVTRGGDVNGDGYDDLIATKDINNTGVIYLGGTAGIQSGSSSAAQIRFESNQANAGLGVTVESAGDVNGDGFGDLILGASGYDSGEDNEGAVFVIHGGVLPAFPSLSTAASMIQSNRANASLGIVATSAGDVNGDGYGDIVIGANNYDDGRGLALIYHGGPTGIVAAGTPANASGRFEIPWLFGTVGNSVAGPGDVNGDGFDDVVVAAPTLAPPTAFVLHGSLAGIGDRLPVTANGRLFGSQSDISFATRVSAAGDLNRDGFADVMVSAPTLTNGEPFEGAAFVFHGSASGFGNKNELAANARIESNLLAQSLTVLGPAGDVNGDGYGDVLFGVPLYESPEVREGGAWLFLGGPAGITGTALADAASGIGGNSPQVLFGSGVSPAGDVNGDGFGDWLVGSPGSSSDPAVLGRALLYYGSASPTFAQTPTTITSQQSLALFGNRVGFAGDVNGDARSDVIVGATGFESTAGESNEGLAVVFQSNVRGRPVVPLQRRSNQGSPVVAPGKTSALLSGFTLEFGAGHLEPTGRIAGEFQVCPVGTQFGTPGCTTVVTGWLQGLGISFAGLSHPFTGLTPNTRYNWRGRALLTDDTGPIPTVPKHGPWRRLQPSLNGYDIRTARDTDLDGVVDSLDNCPRLANPGQEDLGGLGLASGPDKIGDACQCGNVAGTGRIDGSDVTAFRNALANPTGAPLTAAAQTRCVVLTPGSPCNVLQVAVLRRALATPTALYPITTTPAAQFCTAAVGS